MTTDQKTEWLGEVAILLKDALVQIDSALHGGTYDPTAYNNMLAHPLWAALEQEREDAKR